VADHEFMFALDLSDQAPFDEMLDDVAGSVLRHVGYGGEMTGDLVALLRAALSHRRAPGPQQCRVQFTAHAGELDIVVSGVGGFEWRTTRPLP
jgi:hypothetical protein